MKTLRRLADNSDASSAAHGFRRRRFAAFLKLIEDCPRPVRVLDVGGTEEFWRMMGLSESADVQVTLVNILPVATTLPNFTSVVADACDLSMFKDLEFPVVFSNSVIEHVPSREGQRRMASEIRRVGVRYFVQTPNRYFPIEPHFLFPFFQFLPLAVKLFLLRRYQLGWAKQAVSREEAILQAASIRLLSKSELRGLFPEGRIEGEWWFGLCKSFVAISDLSLGDSGS